MIKVCVFDLDGTVMDTLDSIAYFVNTTMEKMQLPTIETEKFKYFAGNGRTVLLQKSLAHNNALTPENLEKAIKIYDAAYENDFMHLTKPFDGIKQELLKIKDMGIKIAVLSNKPHNMTEAIVEKTFGKDFFAQVFGQREGVKTKPNPDGLLSIAKTLGADAGQCVMIGDSDVDMQTGKNAGAYRLGVLWGFRTRSELEENGAQVIATKMEELAKSIANFEEKIKMEENTMLDISKVDANFKIETKIDKDDIKFHKIDDVPFKIYGVFKENGKYRRMPESVAKTVSEGVYRLHSNAAGGRVRFVTNSPYIAINAVYDGVGKMAHFAFAGSIGFDMYADNLYVKTFVPPIDIEDGYEGLFEFDTAQEREITINFPLYSNVKELYIGLQEGAIIKEAKDYKNVKPIVYYGSSITQGGCASRPGMSYQAIVSRTFDYDYINLGFSGNAKAEDEIVEYIKNLDMSLFVYDYDHNAPTVEHLRNTHEKMFKAIREKHPLLPIIMMSRPKFYLNDENKMRREIIETTYNNALSQGDKNVYFLDGEALTELCKDSGTVDNCHPTDFGFASMADALIKVMANIEID